MDQFSIQNYNRHQINIYTGDIHATVSLHKLLHLALEIS